jgi:hypothetical protein
MRQRFIAAATVAAGFFSLSQLAGPVEAVANLPQVQMVDSLMSANQFFISQYRSTFNPDATDANANCGPASLAMGLKRYLAQLPLVQPSSAEKLVRMARIAMTGSTDPDVNTDNFDVIHGARQLGLRARLLHDLSAVDAALESGGLAIVSGSPSVPGSFGKRLSYRHCKGGHFIVIAGKHGDRYLMNDPECPEGAAEITRAELAAFMSFWPPDNGSLHGAVALYPSSNPDETRIAELSRATAM